MQFNRNGPEALLARVRELEKENAELRRLLGLAPTMEAQGESAAIQSTTQTTNTVKTTNAADPIKAEESVMRLESPSIAGELIDSVLCGETQETNRQ